MCIFVCLCMYIISYFIINHLMAVKKCIPDKYQFHLLSLFLKGSIFSNYMDLF